MVPRVLEVGSWTPIGPQPTSAGTNFVTSGRVNSIAIDPRNNNIVYAGAAEGGVWKSTDGGATWKPLTDAQPSMANGAIALDPSNPDTVYVGTGEENFAIDSYYGAGILKSTDAGRNLDEHCRSVLTRLYRWDGSEPFQQPGSVVFLRHGHLAIRG